jgi:hypothetical protein
MTPCLVEDRTDSMGTYTEVWMCHPPRKGVKYRIIRDEWDGDIRKIHEWRRVTPVT